MPKPFPTKPNRAYSFTGLSQSQPGAQQPGMSMDAEYDRANNAIGTLIEFIAQALDAEGRLKAEAVDPANLTTLVGATGAIGPAGPTGPEGVQGPAGPQGVQGPTGAPYTPAAIGPTAGRAAHDGEAKDFGYLDTTTGTLYFKLTNASGDWSAGVSFGQGPTGAQGPTGPTGAQGPAGSDGANGAKWYSVLGLPASGLGEIGDFALRNEGSIYEKLDATTWQFRVNITGPLGLTGPQGATGLTGAQGPTGPVGAPGVPGPAGSQGPLGPAGPAGPAAGPGMVAWFAMPTLPAGWLKANGAAVSRATYAGLFAAIGTTYGAGDGSTTFNLPDLRGEFIRGVDDGRGVDPGRVLGSAQGDDLESHTHTAAADSAGGHTHTANNFARIVGNNSSPYDVSAPSDPRDKYNTVTGGSTQSAGAHSHTVTVDPTGGSETRPRNVALVAAIKF